MKDGFSTSLTEGFPEFRTEFILYLSNWKLRDFNSLFKLVNLFFKGIIMDKKASF